MTTEKPAPVSFHPGLTPEQSNECYDIEIAIHDLVRRIEALPRHRSFSVAVTKLDEARHWVRDRKHRAP